MRVRACVREPHAGPLHGTGSAAAARRAGRDRVHRARELTRSTRHGFGHFGHAGRHQGGAQSHRQVHRPITLRTVAGFGRSCRVRALPEDGEPPTDRRIQGPGGDECGPQPRRPAEAGRCHCRLGGQPRPGPGTRGDAQQDPRDDRDARDGADRQGQGHRALRCGDRPARVGLRRRVRARHRVAEGEGLHLRPRFRRSESDRRRGNGGAGTARAGPRARRGGGADRRRRDRGRNGDRTEGGEPEGARRRRASGGHCKHEGERRGGEDRHGEGEHDRRRHRRGHSRSPHLPDCSEIRGRDRHRQRARNRPGDPRVDRIREVRDGRLRCLGGRRSIERQSQGHRREESRRGAHRRQHRHHVSRQGARARSRQGRTPREADRDRPRPAREASPIWRQSQQPSRQTSSTSTSGALSILPTCARPRST